MLTIEKDVLQMVYDKMKDSKNPLSKVRITLDDVLNQFPSLKEEPRYLIWDAVATLEGENYIESVNNSNREGVDFTIIRLTYLGYLKLHDLERQ